MALAEPNLGRLELIDFRDNIIARLRELFPVSLVPTIEKFRGKRTAETIRRYGDRTPAIFVAVMGIDDVTGMGAKAVHRPVQVALIVETRISDGEADDANLAIVDTLTMQIPYETWGACAQVPSMVRAVNNYNKGIDGSDVNQWTVLFVQSLRTEALTEEELANLDDFLRAYFGYDINPDNPDAPKDEQQVNVREP